MVCLGIPTLRPLYLRRRGSIGYSGYADRHRSGGGLEEQLPQFTMIDQKPPIFDPSLRDSSSCHTDVEACGSGQGSGQGSVRLDTPTRPATAHARAGPSHYDSGELPARPATAQTRVAPSRYDSVDEIFNMYDQNDPRHPDQNTGVIWVKSEVQVSRKDHVNWPLRS
jgi:hypothetical protein